MFSNGRRRVSVFINAFMQIPASETNITCITQVTFEFVNKTLMVDELLILLIVKSYPFQSLRPFYVATAMTYGTKANIAVPSPEAYVKSALCTLGMSRRNTGYWSHGIQVPQRNS